MNKFKSLFVIITLALMTFSCAKKIPYSKEIETKYGITEKSLGGLQFYLVNDIILVSDDNHSNNNSTD